MKNKIFIGLLLMIMGFLLGNTLINYQKKLLNSFHNIESFYVLQEGVYSNKDNIQKYTSQLSQKVIAEEKHKYVVYVGITKDKNIANKLKKIYEKNGYQIDIREKNIESEEFLANVTQFDLLIKAATTEDEILTIEEVVLANYEEITKK